LRDVPIITLVNKLDREGRDPFELLDKIEQCLALDVTFSAPKICLPMRSIVRARRS